MLPAVHRVSSSAFCPFLCTREVAGFVRVHLILGSTGSRSVHSRAAWLNIPMRSFSCVRSIPVRPRVHSSAFGRRVAFPSAKGLFGCIPSCAIPVRTVGHRVRSVVGVAGVRAAYFRRFWGAWSVRVHSWGSLVYVRSIPVLLRGVMHAIPGLFLVRSLHSFTPWGSSWCSSDSRSID